MVTVGDSGESDKRKRKAKRSALARLLSFPGQSQGGSDTGRKRPRISPRRPERRASGGERIQENETSQRKRAAKENKKKKQTLLFSSISAQAEHTYLSTARGGQYNSRKERQGHWQRAEGCAGPHRQPARVLGDVCAVFRPAATALALSRKTTAERPLLSPHRLTAAFT